MKSAHRVFLLALSAAALTGLSACKERAAAPAVAAAPKVTLPVLGPAPAWTLHDLAGREVRSADYRGKVVVVDFWATWCGPCKEEIPGYIELQKKYADKGLVILGLSMDLQGPPVVKRYAESAKINYPLVMGDDEVASAFGGIEAIPTTFLIDRSGQIRHKKIGMMPTAEYEKLLVQLLE